MLLTGPYLILAELFYAFLLSHMAYDEQASEEEAQEGDSCSASPKGCGAMKPEHGTLKMLLLVF